MISFRRRFKQTGLFLWGLRPDRAGFRLLIFPCFLQVLKEGLDRPASFFYKPYSSILSRFPVPG